MPTTKGRYKKAGKYLFKDICGVAVKALQGLGCLFQKGVKFQTHVNKASLLLSEVITCKFIFEISEVCY